MTIVERRERWRGMRHRTMVLVSLASLIAAPLEWWPKMPSYIFDVLTGFQVLILVGYVMHTRELCEKCISSIPLDPQKAVDHEKPLLWLNHRWKIRLVLWVGCLATAIFTDKTSALHMAVNSTYDLIFSMIIFATVRHSRLEPWCPWCRYDGDGGASEKVPDPTDDNNKPAPV